MVSALSADPGVPVTLAANGQTIGVLVDTTHLATLDQLGALAADGTHQFLAAPFTPVDATNLVAAGWDRSSRPRSTRGSDALSSGVPHGSGVSLPTPAGVGAGLGAWVTNDDVDNPTLTALAADGYSQVVLPADSVDLVPYQRIDGRDLRARFRKGIGHRGRVRRRPRGPLHRRHRRSGARRHPARLRARAALLRKPNDLTPRGVAVVAPNGWTDDPTFVATLLGALQNNPMVEPVTALVALRALPLDHPCRGGCRLTALEHERRVAGHGHPHRAPAHRRVRDRRGRREAAHRGARRSGAGG